MYDSEGSVTITERAGDVSVAFTIHVKDRKVIVTETIGEVSADEEIDYDDLPTPILKAYQAWLMNLDV